MKRTILFIGLLLSFSSHAALVGKVNDSFGVSGGSANYSIPIDVPPGRGGMQPGLAINYNSAGGNGLMGIGFSLSGFSVITRCGKTIATDGVKGGVNYDGKDRFCLDGQRLIAVKGANGGNGAEYRTETDSFSKIISYSRQGSGPMYWRVWTKSGQILEYGYTGDSRIEAQGTINVRVWALNKMSDRVGNKVNYSYYENNAAGEYYPTGASYAGGRVVIDYAGRPDTFSGYQAGRRVSSSRRVTKVRVVSSAGQEVRSYTIKYAPRRDSFDKSRVASIRQCNLGQCLPEVVFEWDIYTKQVKYTAKNASMGYGSAIWNQSAPLTGDVNGDGRTDLIFAWYHKAKGRQIMTMLSSGDGTFTVRNASMGYSTAILNQSASFLTGLKGGLSSQAVRGTATWNKKSALSKGFGSMLQAAGAGGTAAGNTAGNTPRLF